MGKKRSIGVTIFGWLFIIFGILGLLIVRNYEHYSKIFGMGVFLFETVTSLASVICGVFILRLHPSARAAAIILCLFEIISVPFYLNPISDRIIKSTQSSVQSNNYYEREKQRIREQFKPEYQQKALESLEERKVIGQKRLPIFLRVVLVIFCAPFILLDLVTIYFFTRSKVREQFT